MGEVYFYHLTRSPVDTLVPDLIGKCRSRDWRVALRGAQVDRLKWLSDRIWAFGKDSFLAHGIAGGEHDENQPVLLTANSENTNFAQVLMIVDNAAFAVSEANDYQRTCIIFDGNSEEAVTSARGIWREVTASGISAQYWAQEEGAWKQKAKSG